MIRLKSDLWVRAYLQHLQQADIPAFVVAKGDPDSGAVMVKLNLMNGSSRLFQRSFDFQTNRRSWILSEESEDHDIDERIRREMNRDSDLWIIEVEDRHGRTMLDESGLIE